ncbi:hypothetical protein Micant_00011 [Erwinia phage Micant]|uniref:Uncharacterized protein n=1 Tax=Erwinia phage Micant TaxID=2923255 RepID=A0AAE9FMB1_9CAUD|nr:hypothetical protein Micant_00011 [Erwinia phage Micant]
MFGTKAARIMQLEHRTKVLQSNLIAAEHQRDSVIIERDIAKRSLIRCQQQIAKLDKELNSPFRTSPHEHNLSELETRIHADMLARPEQYSEHFGISRGRWSGRGPSLQNLPRRPSKTMVNVSFEYKGTRTTFGVNDIVRSLHTLDLQDGKKLRVICIKYDGSQTQYDYEVSRITSEIRKEFK